MIDIVRRAQVYALWNSQLEWLPTVRTTLDTAKVNPVGFVTGKRVPCGRCRATGRVRGHGADAFACQTCASALLNALKLGATWTYNSAPHGCRTCLLCDGTGWRLARRGETGEDEYRKRGHQDQADSFEQRIDRKRQRDAEIARLERFLKTAEPASAASDPRDPTDGPEWWLSAAARQKEHLYARGSYPELAGAMEVLRAITPLRHELVLKVEVFQQYGPRGHGTKDPISPRTRALVDATADWVAALMPKPIVVPAEHAPEVVNEAAKESLWRGRTDQHEAARDRRRDRVIRAHGEWGWSPEEIAAHESLSARRVRQLLAERRALAGEDAAVATGPAA